MKVSEYIGKFLVENNVNDIFFVDGGACASIIVGVTKNKNINYYCPQHEQSGAFAVDGYYKTSRKISAMIATSGPAAQNLINGIAASWYDSVPAIYITGNVKTSFLKKSESVRQLGFQESDIVSMVKGITKYSTMLMTAKNIKYELEKALYYATESRPGPILIDIPMDIQETEVNIQELLGFKSFYKNVFVPENSTNQILKIKEYLKTAKKPAFLIGGGVWISDATSIIKKLIKQTNVPYFVTWNMADFDSYTDELYGGKVGTFGGEGRNIAIQECDLLLCLGTRLPIRVTGNNIKSFASNARKIVVNIEQEELMHHPIDLDHILEMDVNDFAQELLREVDCETYSHKEWNDRVRILKENHGVVEAEYYNVKGYINPYVFMEKLSDNLTKDAIIVSEAGGNAVVTYQTYKAKNGQRIFSNHGNSSLGYALPASIGAAIASKKQVICLTGDGGLSFNIQELQTVQYYSLPIIIFVFNNNGYGITKAFRDSNFYGSYEGCDAEHGMSSPDYIKIADSYGINSLRINNLNELNSKLPEILLSNKAMLIDVNMGTYNDYLPRVEGMNSIENMYPPLEFK